MYKNQLLPYTVTANKNAKNTSIKKYKNQSSSAFLIWTMGFSEKQVGYWTDEEISEIQKRQVTH